MKLALQLVGGGDHFVGALRRACLDDRRVPVAGDRDVRRRGDDGADGRGRAQQPFDAGHDGLEAGVRRGFARGVDDGHEAVAAQALEVAFDELARLDRVRAAHFPAGPREGRLDLGREEAERKRDRKPGAEDGAEVRGGPAAEASERAERGGVGWRGGPRRLRGRWGERTHDPASADGWSAERNATARPSRREAGPAPAGTQSHWLMPVVPASTFTPSQLFDCAPGR